MIKKIEELAFQVHQQKRNQKNRVVKIKKNFKKDKICGH